ncbi:unnamed protein product [Diamesa tonsa]
MKLPIKVTLFLILNCVTNYECKSFGSGWFGGGSTSVSKPVVSSTSGGWFGGGSSSVSKPVVSSNSGGWFGGGSNNDSSNSGRGVSIIKPIGDSRTGVRFNEGVSIIKPIEVPTFTKPVVNSGTGGWSSTGVPDLRALKRNRTVLVKPIAGPTINNQIGNFSGLFAGGKTRNESIEGPRSTILFDDLPHWLEQAEQNKFDIEKEQKHETEDPFEKIQPSSKVYSTTVLSAATRFKLFQLPLDVSSGDPIMHCSSVGYHDVQINFNRFFYSCVNGLITISCYRLDSITKQLIDTCPGRIMNCDTQDTFSIYCNNGYLVNNGPIYCDSISKLNDISYDTVKVLTCYPGYSVESKIFPPKRLSIAARIYIFLLSLIGKYSLLDD